MSREIVLDRYTQKDEGWVPPLTHSELGQGPILAAECFPANLRVIWYVGQGGNIETKLVYMPTRKKM